MTQETNNTKYTLIFDTQSIELGNEGIIRPEVNELFTNKIHNSGLKLVIPAMVQAEIHKHFCRKADLDIKSYTSGASGVRKTLGVQVPEISKTKEELLKVCDKQFNQMSPEIFTPDYKLIDWDSLTKQAVWKLPPFENNEKEKGFKDAMVLEALRQYADNHPKESIRFICRDDRLVQAVESNFTEKQLSNIKIIGSVQEFITALELELQKKSEQLSAIAAARAPDIFLNYIFGKAKKYIETNLGSEINYFSEEKKPKYDWLNVAARVDPIQFTLLSTDASWWAKKEGKYSVTDPTFISVNKDEYRWKTIIVHEREFTRQDYTMIGQTVKKVKTEFEVLWKAKIDNTGAFSQFEMYSNPRLINQSSENKLPSYTLVDIDDDAYIVMGRNLTTGSTATGLTTYPVSNHVCSRCGEPINNFILNSTGLCDNCRMLSTGAAFTIN